MYVHVSFAVHTTTSDTVRGRHSSNTQYKPQGRHFMFQWIMTCLTWVDLNLMTNVTETTELPTFIQGKANILTGDFHVVEGEDQNNEAII